MAVTAALLLACSNDADPGPTSTAAPDSATATAVVSASPTAIATPDPAAQEPDGERIHAIVEQLATDIGPRVVGSSSERQAAELLASMLESAGYEVELQEFTVSREASRESQVSQTAPEQRTLASIPFSGSATGEASGALVPAGLGQPDQFPASARNAIVLIERGDLTFQQKVENAEAAGAAAVIIYNNQAGTFFGSLSNPSGIPAVSISQAEGQALAALAQPATITVSVAETPITESVNVIARPPGAPCQTISGGHFDSVPGAPGANDNASGTATVVEIAMVLAAQGRMGDNCFVLFGAEEIGLVGSRAFVERLTAEEHSQIKAMLNFDMVGFGDEPWYLIGTPAMQEVAADIAAELGIETQDRTIASTGGASDHVNFMQAGIPSIFFYRASDPQWHQPGDTADRLSPSLLEDAARMGLAMIEHLGSP